MYLSHPIPLKEEFYLYQKLWDSLDYREKVDKSDTKWLELFFPFITELLLPHKSIGFKFQLKKAINLNCDLNL